MKKSGENMLPYLAGAFFPILFAVIGASVLISVFLIRGDRKAYPKLYE